MDSSSYYWHAFSEDVLVFIAVLLAAGVLTMIPTWILAWVTAEGIDGVTNGRLLAAAAWAWFVGTCAATWIFLISVGIGIQLQRARIIDPPYFPTPVQIVIVGSTIALTLLVTYRSTRRYLLRCVELRFDVKLAAAVQRARKTRFSLGSLLLCQVLGIASFGLWLECHRDAQQRLSDREAKEQAYSAWVDHMRARCFEKYHWRPAIEGWPHPCLHLTGTAPQPDLNDEVLLLIAPADRIRQLTVRSDQITDEGLRIIGGLSTLRQLTIESTHVTDKGIEELARLKNLTHLKLKCPQVTERSLAVFSQFPVRTCIAIESGKIREEVAEQFGREHYNVSFPPHVGEAPCCLR